MYIIICLYRFRGRPRTAARLRAISLRKTCNWGWLREREAEKIERERAAHQRFNSNPPCFSFPSPQYVRPSILLVQRDGLVMVEWGRCGVFTYPLPHCSYRVR